MRTKYTISGIKNLIRFDWSYSYIWLNQWLECIYLFLQYILLSIHTVELKFTCPVWSVMKKNRLMYHRRIKYFNLRSVAGDSRNLQVSHLHIDYEEIAEDFLIPKLFEAKDLCHNHGRLFLSSLNRFNARAETYKRKLILNWLVIKVLQSCPLTISYKSICFQSDQYFSSVLRLSSGGVRIWTHYDVMDNIYCQIVGHKTAVLWPPDQASNLYLKGENFYLHYFFTLHVILIDV